ncbi:MAG: hypothetical protein A3F42_06850 [Gammaproteobacteria bacterium RIFCSPHIGHO2_12_FULL_37_34]|nr:MAG: hypothetical protein A3F42_06850 [Gammaproteobacteria bacterium RIFCSPHIGHO2_12_FULL_37_34]
MSKTDLVGNLLRERANKLSKVEKLILEIILITRIHQELSPVFSYPHEQYKRLIRSTHSQNQGENMKNISLIQEIIKDVLATKAYTLSGMATHTHIPTEVLSDIAYGINNNPSLELSKQIFEIHIEVRRELYNEIMRKIVSQYLR